MTRDGTLSPLGEMVRRVDPDRYLTALFAPAPQREVLFTLYAFNHELARAREVVREPFAALIRLQWWREVIEGARRAHEVAGPLGAALDAGRLDPVALEAMITGREMEAEGFDTLSDFKQSVLGSAGGVMVAAARTLGFAGAEAVRPWGAAYGVAGILRSLAAHARQGRCLLPLDLVDTAGSSEGAALADPFAAALDPAKARLVAIGRDWLAGAVRVPRQAVSAALPAVYARRDLARPSIPAMRPPWDRMRVVLAGVTGSV